jgi:peptidoglycan LD-endopeptidase LytH
LTGEVATLVRVGDQVRRCRYGWVMITRRWRQVAVVGLAMAAGSLIAAEMSVAASGDPRPRPVMAGAVRDVVIGGRFGVPADAAAVVVNITVVNPAESTFVTVWPAGRAKPATSNVNARAGVTVASAAVVALGRDASVSMAVGNGYGDVLIDVPGYFTAGGFTSVGPTRAYDSRATGGRVRAGETRLVDIGAAGQAFITITAVQPDRSSFLTVWTAGTSRPPTSNVNLRPGIDVANLALVQTDAAGRVAVFNDAGTTDVIVDVIGRVGSGFSALAPERVLDSRISSALGPDETRRVPTSHNGATAVVANLTATDGTADSFLTAWPDGVRPGVSTLNPTARTAVANLAIVGVDATGAFQIANASGRQHVIVDVLARIEPSAGFRTVPPARVIDTRPDVAAGADVRHGFVVPAGTNVAYARTHSNYTATDVFAACGTPILSPVDGVITEVRRVDLYDPKVRDPSTLGGRSVAIVGDDGVRYYGSHYDTIDTATEPGTRVTVGTKLGTMGRTGDTSVCHLHFGLSPACPGPEWSVRRGVIWPWPYLDAWRNGVNTSPQSEINVWVADNPTACLEAMRNP